MFISYALDEPSRSELALFPKYEKGSFPCWVSSDARLRRAKSALALKYVKNVLAQYNEKDGLAFSVICAVPIGPMAMTSSPTTQYRGRLVSQHFGVAPKYNRL